MAKMQWRGGALLAPVPPVLVTSGTIEKPNVCTVAWCGMLSTKPPKTYVSIRPSRYSYDLIKESGEFVINLPAASQVRNIDFCGVKSGRDTDKFEHCKFTALPSSMVSAPILEQSPVSIECRVEQIIPLGTHDMFLSEIVGVVIDEELLDEKGKLRLDQAGLATYAHGDYFALGKKIGSFGFSVRKRKKRPNPKHK